MDSLPHAQELAAATYQRIVHELHTRGYTEVMSLEEIFPLVEPDSTRTAAQVEEASISAANLLRTTRRLLRNPPPPPHC